MKNALILLFLGLNLTIFGQGVIHNLDIQVLYRGYPNKIVVGKNFSDDVVLKGENVVLTKDGDTWNAMVDKGNSATIRAYSGEVLLSETTYKIKPLPNPEFYWGRAITGGVANFGEPTLDVRYDNKVTLNKKFQIVEWTASFDNKTLSGIGNKLSNDFFTLVQNSSKDTAEVQITVSYSMKGENIIKKNSGIFKLPLIDKNGLDISVSGKITIIDKNSTNTDLFDENNPKSLLGMLKFNYFPLSYGMTDFTEKRLEDFGSTIFDGVRKLANTSPLVSQTDPSKDSVIYNPVNDEYVVQWTVNPYKKYSISNISRIVLFEDSIINETTGETYFGINHIGLCTKIEDESKYDLVAIIPYSELCEMNATSFFQKYEFEGSDSIAKISCDIIKKIDYVSLREEISKNYGNSNRYYFTWVGGDALGYSGFKDLRDDYLNNELFVIQHTAEYATLRHPRSFQIQDTSFFNFHEFSYFGGPLTEPIKSRDPYKMLNDEDSVIYDPISDEYLTMYYLGDPYIYKALADYDIYHQYLANHSDLSHPVLKCVYFAVNNGKESATVMAVPMENPNNDYELYSIQNELASVAKPITITWRETLLDEYRKGVHLDLNKSKSIKVLKNEFYLDQVNGFPVNYFGISE